jgi:predicted nucleic acid-binding Zn ribbon protein
MPIPCCACRRKLTIYAHLCLSLRELFPAGIVFKGSGFYSTDSRRSQIASEPAATASDAGKSSSGGDADASKPSDGGSAASSADKASASAPKPSAPASAAG